MTCILFSLYMFGAGMTAEYLSNKYRGILAPLFWGLVWPARVGMFLGALIMGGVK